MEGINVAEIIPYKTFKQRVAITRQEQLKGRYIEIWDGFIYSEANWRG